VSFNLCVGHHSKRYLRFLEQWFNNNSLVKVILIFPQTYPFIFIIRMKSHTDIIMNYFTNGNYRFSSQCESLALTDKHSLIPPVGHWTGLVIYFNNRHHFIIYVINLFVELCIFNNAFLWTGEILYIIRAMFTNNWVWTIPV
jgi:hypothetical protein